MIRCPTYDTHIISNKAIEFLTCRRRFSDQRSHAPEEVLTSARKTKPHSTQHPDEAIIMNSFGSPYGLTTWHWHGLQDTMHIPIEQRRDWLWLMLCYPERIFFFFGLVLGGLFCSPEHEWISKSVFSFGFGGMNWNEDNWNQSSKQGLSRCCTWELFIRMVEDNLRVYGRYWLQRKRKNRWPLINSTDASPECSLTVLEQLGHHVGELLNEDTDTGILHGVALLSGCNVSNVMVKFFHLVVSPGFDVVL